MPKKSPTFLSVSDRRPVRNNEGLGEFQPACIRLQSKLPCASYFNQLPTFAWKFGFPHTRTSWQQCRQCHKKEDRCDAYSYPTQAQKHSCKHKGKLQNTFHWHYCDCRDSSRAKCDAYSEPVHEVHRVSGRAVCGRHGGEQRA